MTSTSVKRHLERFAIFCCAYNEKHHPLKWIVVDRNVLYIAGGLSGREYYHQWTFDTWQEAWDFLWKK